MQIQNKTHKVKISNKNDKQRSKPTVKMKEKHQNKMVTKMKVQVQILTK